MAVVDEQASSVVGAVQHREHLSPARPHRVFLRLSDEEKRLVDSAAARAGLTPAGYAAKAAVAAASNETGAPGIVAADLREVQRELFAARRAVVMFGNNVNQAAAAYHATGELPVWVEDSVRLCTAAVRRLDELAVRIHRRLR